MKQGLQPSELHLDIWGSNMLKTILWILLVIIVGTAVLSFLGIA